MELNDCQMSYLGLIQGVINRMATCSAAIKGFAATIFAGVLAIVVSNGSSIRWIAILIAMLAVALSFLFDWYYFWQEKQYRKLYDEVRLGCHDCNFDMAPPKYKQIRIRSALKSLSLVPYYGILLLFLFVSLLITCSIN